MIPELRLLPDRRSLECYPLPINTNRIAVFSQKGGVGKTTTALNLGAALARAGHRPLWIDLDPQGYLTEVLGAQKLRGSSVLEAFAKGRSLGSLARSLEDRGDIVAAHMELQHIETRFGRTPDAMSLLCKRIDAWQAENQNRPVVIDCAPQAGLLTLGAMIATRRVLIPVSSDYFALSGALGVERTVQMLQDVLRGKIEMRVLLTRFDSRRRMAQRVEQALRARFGARMCETTIRESVSVAESPSLKKDIFRHAPDGSGAEDYRRLYEELWSEVRVGEGMPVAMVAGSTDSTGLASSPLPTAQPPVAGADEFGRGRNPVTPINIAASGRPSGAGPAMPSILRRAK